MGKMRVPRQNVATPKSKNEELKFSTLGSGGWGDARAKCGLMEAKSF